MTQCIDTAESVTPELILLAETLDAWFQNIPCVTNVYLFGSRVRGDHRPDSDVDLHIDFDFGKDLTAWILANDNDFHELKQELPGPLSIHIEIGDVTIPIVQQAGKNPVLTIGKVICVYTPRIK